MSQPEKSITIPEGEPLAAVVQVAFEVELAPFGLRRVQGSGVASLTVNGLTFEQTYYISTDPVAFDDDTSWAWHWRWIVEHMLFSSDRHLIVQPRFPER